jgi:hypothetical protein
LNDTGAIVLPGSFITQPSQQLPADGNGDKTPATVAENNSGRKAVGLLFTDPSMRPQGSVGTPNAGGVIMRACFVLNPKLTGCCNSGNERVYVKIGTAFVDSSNDIFANDAAERVIVGTANIEVFFGDPGANVRADGNMDGARTPADTLLAAVCSLFGQASTQCNTGANWASEPAAVFCQTFDFDCSGMVTPADVLGNAQLCLGIANRTNFKNLTPTPISGKGMITVDYSGSYGALANATIHTAGLRVRAPFLSEEAQKAGWAVVHQINSNSLQYTVLNTRFEGDTAIPAVRFEYEAIYDDAKVAILDTFHQRSDFSEFDMAPSIHTQGVYLEDKSVEGDLEK